MANNPSKLLYAKSHEWIQETGTTVLVGLTDFAQDALGDIVFINLPSVGDAVTVGESFADVESVKAVSDVYSPVTGIVVNVNNEAADSPQSVNESPYDTWLIEVGDVTAKEEMLSADEYGAFCKEETE